MNNSNSINTPLHVINFVASLSNFANDGSLLFRGSVNYTRYRFTFAGLHAQGMNIASGLSPLGGVLGWPLRMDIETKDYT